MNFLPAVFIIRAQLLNTLHVDVHMAVLLQVISLMTRECVYKRESVFMCSDCHRVPPLTPLKPQRHTFGEKMPQHVQVQADALRNWESLYVRVTFNRSQTRQPYLL